MARSKSSAAARFSAIFRRNPRAKREKLPAVDIGYSLGPGCCQQRLRVRSLIPDSASRLALDEPQSRDASTSVLPRRGCGDRKQGRLLDRALRGAPSLKPGVSKPFKIEQSQPTRQQLGVEAVGFKDTSPNARGTESLRTLRGRNSRPHKKKSSLPRPAISQCRGKTRRSPAVPHHPLPATSPESHRSRCYMRNCFLCRRPMERYS